MLRLMGRSELWQLPSDLRPPESDDDRGVGRSLRLRSHTPRPVPSVEPVFSALKPNFTAMARTVGVRTSGTRCGGTT
jgi:hypothetical protein